LREREEERKIEKEREGGREGGKSRNGSIQEKSPSPVVISPFTNMRNGA
jgi:hypothetical protein